MLAARLEAETGIGFGVFLERRGDDDLAAARAAGDAGAKHHVAAVHLLFVDDHEAGVQADAQVQLTGAARDGAVGKRALQVECTAQRRMGAVESDHEAVVVGLDNRATVVADDPLDDQSMVSQQLLEALSPQLRANLGRVLDVAEEQRERSVGRAHLAELGLHVTQRRGDHVDRCHRSNVQPDPPDLPARRRSASITPVG
jgi:hypothetical protein